MSYAEIVDLIQWFCLFLGSIQLVGAMFLSSATHVNIEYAKVNQIQLVYMILNAAVLLGIGGVFK